MHNSKERILYKSPLDKPNLDGYSGDTTHVDYIIIAGADIKAFKLELTGQALDVAMVAGYSDLVAGNSRNTIIDYFSAFTAVVKLAGLRLHSDKQNTVAISTLMHPPQLSWFPDNGRFPFPGYRNQLSMTRLES